MSATLLTKLLLGPGLVVAASMAGRRWGSAVSGILVAIPIVLGPILLIITIEHGEAFGAEAATSSLLAMVALAVFVVAFERTGRTRRWEIATLAGWAAFLAVALCSRRSTSRPSSLWQPRSPRSGSRWRSHRRPPPRPVRARRRRHGTCRRAPSRRPF